MLRHSRTSGSSSTIRIVLLLIPVRSSLRSSCRYVSELPQPSVPQTIPSVRLRFSISAAENFKKRLKRALPVEATHYAENISEHPRALLLHRVNAPSPRQREDHAPPPN